MSLIIEITKGWKSEDRLTIHRPDGDAVDSTFPKKGSLPHDLVHLVVESVLGLQNGFWRLVEKGRRPQDLGAMAKEAGHPSASRAACPDASIIELLQSERLVECFEADLWGKTPSFETFADVFEAACCQSRIPAPALTIDQFQMIRAELEYFDCVWRARGVGCALKLVWPHTLAVES